MKKFLIFGIVIIISIFGLLGCSDDDECATCPQLTQQGIANFYTYLNNGNLRCYGVLPGVDGKILDPDSVTIENRKMEIRKYLGEGGVAYCSYSEPSSTGVNPGDTVELEIYMPDGKSTGSVVILEDTLDIPTIYDWLVDYPYDTIATSTEISVSWSDNPDIDFYTVNWRYSYDDGIENQDEEYLFTTTDTNFVIPATSLGYNGRVYIYIYNANGPQFNEDGNISGGVIKGRINSLVEEYFRVYIGTGDPYPSSSEINDDENTDDNPMKILEKMF